MNWKTFFMLKKKLKQSQIFSDTEGDNSFLRNGEHFNFAIYDAVMKLNPPKSNSLLEIGCGCGSTLKKIKDSLELDVYGIDVSNKAIIHAKKENNITNAKVISWEDYHPKRKFDIVVDGGYLYVTENKLLKKAIEKLLSLTKKNGHLIIWDYDTTEDYSNEWKHDPRLKSYKRNMTRVFSNFLKNDLYLISKELYFHDSTSKFNYNTDDKDCCCCLMIFQKLT